MQDKRVCGLPNLKLFEPLDPHRSLYTVYRLLSTTWDSLLSAPASELAAISTSEAPRVRQRRAASPG